MAFHELKCWPEPFEALWLGHKTCEVRKDDRGFALGDTLNIREWDPVTGDYPYPRRRYVTKVAHIIRGPEWGIPAGMVVMSLERR